MHSYPTRLITASALLEFTSQRGDVFPRWESQENRGPGKTTRTPGRSLGQFLAKAELKPVPLCKGT